MIEKTASHPFGGLVHIYCGSGKGKTSAALGLGLRACGRGFRVLLVRFLKDEHSGELNALKELDCFTVLKTPKTLPFTWKMTEKEKADYASYAKGMFEDALSAVENNEYDMLILDEACAAAAYGMLDKNAVTAFLKTRPSTLEVVLTGRNPPEEWVELADYVSQIECIKHPFQRGIRERAGIEY